VSSIKSFIEKYTKKITLKNGTEALLRPIKDIDEQLLYDLFSSCSYDTLFYRFMSSSVHINLKKGNIPFVMKVIRRFTQIDYENQLSIVALIKENNKDIIVSEGMYVKTGPDRAEVGALTGDKWQRQGLATNIGTFMMEIAKTKDIKLFEGEILLSNFKLINLMKAMKIKYNKVISHGTLHFEIDLEEPFYE
jgi:acetyltransferase